jgi:hypothetical protein
LLVVPFGRSQGDEHSTLCANGPAVISGRRPRRRPDPLRETGRAGPIPVARVRHQHRLAAARADRRRSDRLDPDNPAHRRALTKAESKLPRYRLLHTAARITRRGRRTLIKIAAGWGWAEQLAAAFSRLSQIRQPLLV